MPYVAASARRWTPASPLLTHSNTVDMKQLLLQTIACCAVLLPFSQAEAKTYGGFAPGKTFTMTVKKKVSTKSVNTTTTKNVPVPAGIPDYKVGQKVKFKIGKKGQFTGPDGLSLPFKTGTTGAAAVNVYYIPPTRTKPQGDTGEVFKTAANQPTHVALFFARFKISGFSGVTNVVSYTLE